MDNTPCKCALRCFDKLSMEQRSKLYNGFWASGDFDVQNSYICGCVKIVEVKRRYTAKGSGSRRSNSRVYYVNNGTVSVRVCKAAFLRIHCLSNGRVDRCLAALMKSGGSPHNDQRGRHQPVNKTSEDVLASVKRHIESFPRYESHYSRSDNPHRRYLSPDLNLAKMYTLYVQECQDDGAAPVSDWIYRKVFNENFNLSFGR